MMNSKLFLQELSGWQLDICGRQKAAVIIEERLDAMHKNIKPDNAKHLLVEQLLQRFMVEEKELNELERVILWEKDAIHRLSLNKESLAPVEQQHQQISERISKEEKLFEKLKQDYNKLLEEMLQ
jgi:hypothetical protein